MTRMLLGIFSNRSDADNAVNELRSNGFDPKNISIIMRGEKDNVVVNDGNNNSLGANIIQGAASGATTGGVIGGIAGLLVGIGAIAVPGIGALLIGGPLAAALGLTGAAATTVSGAVTGLLAGGLVGGLMGIGLPENEARLYEERLREGGILVAAVTDHETEDEARDILEENNADQIRSINIDQNTSRHEHVVS